MIFLIIQGAAFIVFVGGALVAIAQGRAQFSLAPFYQPEFFSWDLVFTAIPVAAQLHRLRRHFDAQRGSQGRRKSRVESDHDRPLARDRLVRRTGLFRGPVRPQQRAIRRR